MNKIIKELKEALNTNTETKAYDTQAEVVRVEGQTLWVHIPGGVDETPVKKTINAKAGDTVQVRVGGGSAWLVGNQSAPPTDDTTAIIADRRASEVRGIALEAQQSAEMAELKADDAYDLATTAKTSADGKNTIYYGASAPTGGTYKTGDTWFNSSEDNAIYMWNGASWAKEELGEDAIANLSITNAKIANGTIQNGKIANLDAAKITTGDIDANRMKTNAVSAINATVDKIDAKNVNASQITVGSLSDGANYSTTSQMNTAIGTAINGIEIGGRNLVWDTEWKNISERWANWGSPTTREIVTLNGKRWLHIVTTATAWQGYSQGQEKRAGYGEIKAGDKIIVSCSAYAATAGQACCVGVHWRNSSWTTVSQNWANFTLTTTEKRYVSAVFTVPDNAVGFNVMVGDNTSTAQELWISEVKLELGNKATDWSPAPEDVQAEIDAKKSVHTLMSSSNGSTYANILTWTTEGKLNSGWGINTASTPLTNVKIGDTCRIAYKVTDMNNEYVYVVGEVTSISGTTLYMTMHGLDTTIIDGGNILTNSIGANQIASNAIDTNKLTVGAQDAMLNDNIEIGGVNLYGYGADMQTSLSGLGNYNNGFSIVTEDGIKCAHATGELNTTKYLQSAVKFTPKPLEVFTFSAWVKLKNITLGTTNPMCAYYMSGANIDGAWRSFSITKIMVDGVEKVGNWTLSRYFNDSKWHYCAITAYFNYNGTSTIPEMRPNIYMRDVTGDMYIHHVKFERGNKATDWNTTETEYITRIDNGGIKVHDAGDTSNYSQINSNGMEVVKGGVSTAKFGEETRVGKKANFNTVLNSERAKFKSGSNGAEIGFSPHWDTSQKTFIYNMGGSDHVSASFTAPLDVTNVTINIRRPDYYGGGIGFTKTLSASEYSETGTNFWGDEDDYYIRRLSDTDFETGANDENEYTGYYTTEVIYTSGSLYKYSTSQNNRLSYDEMGYYMHSGQTVWLNDSVSNQFSGIVLCWSAYVNGTPQNYNWHYQFVPKEQVIEHAGVGTNTIMATPDFNKVGTKYVYVYDNRIVGNDNNSRTGTASGITFANNYWVLRYVIGV